MLSKEEKNRRDKRKPFTIHCSLFVILLVYATIGGIVFHFLEATASHQHHEELHKEKLDCVAGVLAASNSSEYTEVAEETLSCWETAPDERAEWGFVSATLFGFGIITTLGYNKLRPITTNGRLFCMVYGIIGIPLTMIVIASVGQYFREFAGKCRERMKSHKLRRRMSLILKSESQAVEEEEDSPEMIALFVLAVFLVYIAFGALLLPLLDNEVDFVNGLYYNFLCLTAMDFSGLVPPRTFYLPITFIYICIGLAITTLAIEIGSDYMRRLHHFGERVKNVASTKIRFGGKKLNVKDLLHAVGKKCGIDPREIDRLDLDNVVEKTIAIQEGRDTPDSTEPSPAPVQQRAPTPPKIIPTPRKTTDSNGDPPFPPMSPQIIVSEVEETPQEPVAMRPKPISYAGIVASRAKLFSEERPEKESPMKSDMYRRNSANLHEIRKQALDRMTEKDVPRRYSEQVVNPTVYFDNTYVSKSPSP